ARGGSKARASVHGELGSRHDLAADDHELYGVERGGARERVLAEQEEVIPLAYLDGSVIAVEVEELGVDSRGGVEDLAPWDARLLELAQLEVAVVARRVRV